MKPTTNEIRKRWAIPRNDNNPFWSFTIVNSVSMLCDRVDELEAELAAYRNAQGNPHRNYVSECNELLTGKDERIAELETLVAAQKEVIHGLHKRLIERDV